MPLTDSSCPALWTAGCVDIEYDLDPTAQAEPVSSYRKQDIERPDPSKHVVARVYYPANPEGKLRSRRPYLPNSIYARGLAMYALSIALKEQKWWSGIVTGVVSTCVRILFGQQKNPAESGRSLASNIDMFPVVTFSHGLSGTRFLYSMLCSYLARHGFVVVALEHTDGLASAAKPAGDRNWMLYSGWGDKEYLLSCACHRTQEVATCMRALSAIFLRGSQAEHVTTSCKPSTDHKASTVLDELKGRMDLQNIVLMGHSYGAATVADVGSRVLPDQTQCKAACVVIFDPWYPPITPESPARSEWLSGCPVLVLGSSKFNKRSDEGKIFAEGDQPGVQEKVLKACASGAKNATSDKISQRGATFVVPNESQHTMVDDVGGMMIDKYEWCFKIMGVKKRSGKGRTGEGRDMAERCYDATLSYLLHTVPLIPVVRSCISHHLSSRWEHLGTYSEGDSGAGLQGKDSTAARLEPFFAGLRSQPCDADLSGPGYGCMISEDFEP